MEALGTELQMRSGESSRPKAKLGTVQDFGLGPYSISADLASTPVSPSLGFGETTMPSNSEVGDSVPLRFGFQSSARL
ncbi:MAG: hypothetical protein Ct9H300mP30_1450 [Methanobacteriota archaeon]|nr:MAG: hypothetical protein Ct9H300mP30_1450 [Euryarchaeota archaeon]